MENYTLRAFLHNSYHETKNLILTNRTFENIEHNLRNFAEGAAIDNRGKKYDLKENLRFTIMDKSGKKLTGNINPIELSGTLIDLKKYFKIPVNTDELWHEQKKWEKELSKRTELSEGMTNTGIDEKHAKFFRQYDIAHKLELEEKNDFFTSIDLFDNYELIPLELAPIVEFWSDKIENGDEDKYIYCDKFLKECEEHGYTFEYDLDGQPYFLRPISIKEQENLNTRIHVDGLEKEGEYWDDQHYNLTSSDVSDSERNKIVTEEDNIKNDVNINRFLVNVISYNINPEIIQDSFLNLSAENIAYLKANGSERAVETLCYINAWKRTELLEQSVSKNFEEIFSDLLKVNEKDKNNSSKIEELIGGTIKDIAAKSIKKPEYLKQFDNNTQEVINNYINVTDLDENPLTAYGKESQFIDDIFEDIENGVGDLWKKSPKEDIIGKITIHQSGEVIEYTSEQKYLNALENELECGIGHFKHETLARTPELLKSVDDLIYGVHGQENPNPLEYYRTDNFQNLITNNQNPKIMENNNQPENQAAPKKWKINFSKESEFHIKDLHNILDLKNKGAVYNFIKRNFGQEIAEDLRKTEYKYPSAESEIFSKMKEKAKEIETIKPQLGFFEKDMKTQEWRDVIKNYNFSELNKDGKITLAHVDYLLENLPREDMVKILDEFKVKPEISNTFKEVFENANIEDILNFPLSESKLEEQFKEERYHLVNTINLNDKNKEIFISVGTEYLENAKQKNNDQEITK